MRAAPPIRATPPAGDAGGLRPAPIAAVVLHPTGGPALGTNAAMASLCVASLGAAGLGTASGSDADWSSSTPILCPFRLATGLPCPFCGLTRSLFAAGQGRWQASFDLHPLGPAVLLLAAVMLGVLARAALLRKRVGWARPVAGAGGFAVAAAWIFQLSKGAI